MIGARGKWLVGSEEGVPPLPPTILYEYQKKWVTEFAIRNSLILKGTYFG
jgi:hypothetical protein